MRARLRPAKPGPPGLTSITPWYVDAGEVCRTRDRASVTLAPCGLLWSSGTASEPHSAPACARAAPWHGPQVMEPAEGTPAAEVAISGSVAAVCEVPRAPVALTAPAVPAAPRVPSPRHPAVTSTTILRMAVPLGTTDEGTTLLLLAMPVNGPSGGGVCRAN